MEGNKEKRVSVGTIYGIILFLVFLFIGGLFYYQIQLVDKAVFELGGGEVRDRLPDGVEVEKMGHEKWVAQNSLDGYVVPVDSNDVVEYEAGLLRVTSEKRENKTEEGGYIPQFTISKIPFLGTLEEYVESWIVHQEFSGEYNLERKKNEWREYFFIVPPSFGSAEQIIITKEGGNIFIINSYFINVEELLNSIIFS